jgi:hypothetical protein
MRRLCDSLRPPAIPAAAAAQPPAIYPRTVSPPCEGGVGGVVAAQHARC